MENTPNFARIKFKLLRKVAEFKALRLYEKIYATSMATFLGLSVATTLFPSARQVLNTLVVVASHGFLVGFITWAWPAAKARWETMMGTIAKAIIHVLAILIATAVARYQVSMAMGLPAQDFELTVSFVALLLYLPALAFILSLLLAPSFLFGLVLLLVAVFRENEMREGRVLTGVAHVIGAVGLSIYAGQFFHWSAQDKPDAHMAVRLLAAVVDYQPSSLYPGIKKGQRVRLHENGVVSAIDLNKEGIVVLVWKFEQ